MSQGRKRFVRNAADKVSGIRFPFVSALKVAFCGLLGAFKTQRNMKFHAAAALCALAAGAVLGIGRLEWVAVVICIGAVFAAECMNTALEAVVDLVSPEYHELARRAKDCAAAAVLVLAGMAAVVGAVVFGGAVLSRFG